MRRRILIPLVICVAIIAVFLLPKQEIENPASPPDLATQTEFTPLPASPSRPANSPPNTPDPGHPDALAFGTADIPPEREIAVLMELLEVYRREFGSFPTGNENPHFINALAGANPSQLVIFPISHPRISATGELLDAWASPFHFHLIDRHHLEIRSAGPDREFFTDDDITTPQRSSSQDPDQDAVPSR